MKKAFTLIELLTTITIFSIVVTAFLNLFSSAFQEQRKNLIQAYLLNNASYITEYLSRALRMAKKDMTGICIGEKENYQNPGGEISRIKFLNDDEECQEFFFDSADEMLKIAREGVSLPLTPSNIKVKNLKFEILGASQTDKLQPKVTIVLKLKTTSQPSLELEFQTTVSQRQLDVQY